MWGPRRAGHDDMFKILVDKNGKAVQVSVVGHASTLGFKYGDKNKKLCTVMLKPLCTVQTVATWNLLNRLTVNCPLRGGNIIWGSHLLDDVVCPLFRCYCLIRNH